MMRFYRKSLCRLKQYFRLAWGALIGTAAILAGCCAHYIDHDHHTED